MKTHFCVRLFVLIAACALCVNAQTKTSAVTAPTPAPATTAPTKPAPAASPSPIETANQPSAAAKGSFVLPPEKSQPVVLPKFEKPPVIDGKLDDDVWKNAAVLKDFYQIQPGDNTSPSKPTTVLIGF